jgi:ABC-type polysaccharide/polyol phosphate export permease
MQVLSGASQLARLTPHFTRREVKSRYLGSVSGLAWAFLHPLAQLALYATVFVHIFKARIPEAAEVGFVPYVAAGFWAWLLFAEGASRCLPAIVENASLIGKVRLPAEVLVIASIIATFSVHLTGFAVVLMLLALTGTSISPAGALMAIPVLMMLGAFTLGIGFIFAACQVFVRDLAQIVQQLLAFGFFLTPILYSRSMLPEFARDLMAINPLTYYPEKLRLLLLSGDLRFGAADVIALAVALTALILGLALFRRLSQHFEDFL